LTPDVAPISQKESHIDRIEDKYLGKSCLVVEIGAALKVVSTSTCSSVSESAYAIGAT